ncbi:MAG: hypothetical protein LBU87_05980 [Lactobacillales bacterium]|jgi:hypothetical protein|nr:hypothetical protein [Lactobacillales bacterium]
MREPILKAVAMPPRLFLAPFIPAVANLAVQLMFMFIALIWSVNPLYFVASILIVHIIIISYGVKEPHVSKIMKAQGQGQGGGGLMSPSKNIYPAKGKKLAP